MNSSRQNWKKWIGAALALLLAADIALAVFLVRSSREAPDEMRANRGLPGEPWSRLLKADVERGQKIRASLPQVGKDCQDFYQHSFLDNSIGYSSIESDLGAIAAKAGLKTSGFSFSRKDVKDRGVTGNRDHHERRWQLSLCHRIHQWFGAFEEFLFAE